MKIDGKKLGNKILTHLKKEIKANVSRNVPAPKLIAFTVKPNEETQSYMRSKKAAARKIGAELKIVSYKKTPKFQDFATKVSEIAHQNDVHGVIIQEPLPASLSTVTLFNYIPDEKEIEGFKKKPLFEHPIGLAVLTALKQIYSPEDKNDTDSIIINLSRDILLFKQVFKRKRVVLLGRGKTGGMPIGNILTKSKINYINLNSQTSTASSFTQMADVIISAVGKNIIKPELVKEGATIISIGMRKERGRWKGDFNEAALKNKLLAYTPTPGGIGALNVAYLMYNLVKAWKIQSKLK